MSFFRVLIILSLVLLAAKSIADESTQKQKVLDQTNEIAKQLQEDDEVPLNDPFAGNEAGNSSSNLPEGEEDNEMSLYNFKLAGLISGKDHSYISVVSSAGEAITLTLGQYLGKNQFIDLFYLQFTMKK